MNQRHLPFEQTAELLGRLACFNGVAPERLKRLAASTRQINLQKGERLYSREDHALSVYVVVGGRIKVFLPLSNQAEKVVALVERGHALGVAAAYLGQPHAAHAVAHVPSNLVAIERDVLLREVCQDAGLACRMLGAVAREQMALLNDLESCTHRSSVQRVACYLLQQRPRPDIPQYEFVLPVSKRDVAAKLNIAPETLSRVLNQLHRERIIDMNGRFIRVLDSEQLTALNLSDCAPEQAVA